MTWLPSGFPAPVEIEVIVPAAAEFYISNASVSGDFSPGYDLRLQAQLKMETRNRLLREEPLRIRRARVEALPQSLALLLALDCGAAIEVPLPPASTLDWHVTEMSIAKDDRWKIGHIEVEIEFESLHSRQDRAGRLFWHRPNWTPPAPIQHALREFVAPLYALWG